MRSTVWLRVASVLTLVHAVLHTMGGVFGQPTPGVAAMVADAMRTNHFQAFGVTRSYAEFYRGFGLGITIFMLLVAVLLWQMGELAKRDARGVRPMMAAMMVGFLVFAVNSVVYFFAAPVVVEVLIAGCLAAAMVSASRTEGVAVPARV